MADHIKLKYGAVCVWLQVAWLSNCVNGEPKVPCYFIFGDSLVDSGNNNNLATTAKVDYQPYGIDFTYGPTGRFTNGRTSADIIGELLGFDSFIPPYLSASGSQILKGVNYASGSAGIRSETGKAAGVNIDLTTQLQRHQVVISRIAGSLGSEELAMNHLNKCLYSFVIGSNDYINNYFLPQFYNTSKEYSPVQFAEVLIEEYKQKIMSSYNSGARKVALTGIGRIGCTPNAIATYGTNGSLCVDYMNNAANLFNGNLKSLVDQLKNDLMDANFVYLDAYGAPFQNISTIGLRITSSSCCQVNGYGLCTPKEAPCTFRNSYLFWDAFHPTQIVNQVGATTSYPTLLSIL
ncbi:hypothetical protein K2173_006561 [Erythroxylum novogranatense]|uniref:GDSL esterase/lipase n=1 Tax=Erythroxylum novogranatense TaxID=1862640 RepID=A0AAV8T6H3_9ROSI|nr:hypothetical protein K2173_006561 [Erythroxylum novogranatense]